MASYNDLIRIWAYGDYVEAAHEAVKIYKRDVDPDVNVQITTIELSELDDRLNAALQSGDPPDIVLLDDERIKRYLKEIPGWCVPLNAYMTQLDIASSFMNYEMENVTSESGKICGIPYSSLPAVLYYREGILNGEELSIDALSTWDGLRQYGELLRDKGNYFLICKSS